MKLHIVIHSLGMPFNEKTIFERSLGGSETAAYYQARELARRGYQVDLWTSTPEDSRDELGVRYTSVGQLTPEHPLGARFEQWAATTPHDVLIIQRHPLAFHKKWAASVCLWQLHDLALHRSTGATYHGLWQINAITCVSEWHRQQVLEVYGLKPSAVKVVRNGVDPELYAGDGVKRIGLQGEPAGLYENAHGRALRAPDNAFAMLYQSRPERGLEHLVRPGGIMDRLRETRAHLFVCGYDNTIPQMAYKYAEWEAMARALPNVTLLGALTKPQLAALQKSCDLLCYPTEFDEVSCITAMEAMHAGLPMLTTDAGALYETCRDSSSGTILNKLKDGKADEDAFVTDIIQLMSDGETGGISLEEYGERQYEAAELFTWSCAVDDLEQLIVDQFRAARTPERMVRHGFEHSDLELAVEAIDALPLQNDTFREHRLYDFAASSEAYAAHYAKHQGAYYDEHEDRVIGEDVTSSSRFRGVMSYFAMKQQQAGKSDDGRPAPLRVLDYGCAHGHYLLKFAQWLPQSEFFGVDISERAIAAALKWAVRDQITNVTLAIGGIEHPITWAEPAVEHIDWVDEEGEAVRDGTTGGIHFERGTKEVVHDMRFDVIIAGEVLEHVPDPFALSQKLLNLLKPGGVLIGTTPVGRWEWSGIEAFRHAREHLWHFTKQDLECMFEDYVHDISYAAAGGEKTGALLGSYVFSVTQHETASVCRPPIEDRLAPIVPRQTVGACLIVKDGEQTIRRCVTSFIDWVDEIVIAIDPKTKDRTRRTLELLQDDYPLKKILVVEGVAAVEDGFDAARNVALAELTTDWALWLDADEELQQPWNIWKYLRQSAIDGVGLPQVHYSCNPPQVLTTDFPTRLFRRSSCAKFFGVVHEHPEVEPGKAVPYTIVRHDVQFLHAGYVDEETRRHRYKRNVPLLKVDLERYPGRLLNKFLVIRDLAQGVMFDLERTQGNVIDRHLEEARRVVALFDDLLLTTPHLRLLIDALEFYSQMVAVLGEGFEAQFTLATAKPGADQLNVKTEVKGRFRTREAYLKFVNRLAEEATKHYESKYL